MEAQQSDEPASTGQSWRDFWVVSQDGLKLHGRDYGSRDSRLPAVVCLPGLTRSARDFHVLAGLLTAEAQEARRVVALDLRGRGQSDYDRDVRNYTPQREMFDVLDVMTAIGLEQAIIIGTSRGGLIAMAMALARPGALLGVVLNDIGPRIESQGLMRIMSQINRMPKPGSWDDATALMRRMFQDSFTDLSDEDWTTFAREVFRDEKGEPKLDFDLGIMQTLNADDIAEGRIPELWSQFDALRHFPVLAIRGENSEILSAETVLQMAARHLDLTAVTIPHRGHAPFLREPASIEAIKAFLSRIDAKLAAD